ncbi:hypothetical protein ASE00_08010 [Sphingomonas sp. Root710]|uniref:hypothetical protein n=1 Tax=Sphingomonas sp. Root710 TaxID=1736594 RepID=UPI000701E178|nr:hypothetical protein [Sphingomonas sp. Root710]KRB86620.1 hypothetical protein ASE00_08010 [Sphingomonas sp. Root710]
MRISLLTAIAAGALIALPAQARENRPVKCDIGDAKHSVSSGGPALVANVPSSMTPIDLNAVQMTDKKLANRVVVEAMFARRTETNSVEVITRFVNCTKKVVELDARSSFMDADQVPTEDSTFWKKVILQPKATGVYRGLSIGRDEVKYYLVEVRTSQP